MSQSLEHKLSHVSIGYRLIRAYSKHMIFSWYSHVEIAGQEHIPHNEPYIILPCHQNAAMDCVTVLALLQEPVVFFARSDMFSTPLKANLMYTLKIMPAYRHQEGWGNIKKNEENFQMAVRWLSNGIPLCIMPEGGQDEKHRLRAFVKGPFRVAMGAQKNLSPQPVWILPIGLEHGNYDQFGYPLAINIGEPISVNPYLPQADESEAVKINQLRDHAFSAVQKLMVDIPLEHYQEILTADYLCQNLRIRQQGREDNEISRLQARQELTNRLTKVQDEQWWQHLTALCQVFYSSRPDLLTIAQVLAYPENKSRCTLYCLLFAPLFLLALTADALVLLVMKYAQKHSPAGFAATIQYALLMLAAPVYYVIFSIVTGVCLTWWWGLIALVLLPLLQRVNLKLIPHYRLLWHYWCKTKQKRQALQIQDHVWLKIREQQ